MVKNKKDNGYEHRVVTCSPGYSREFRQELQQYKKNYSGNFHFQTNKNGGATVFNIAYRGKFPVNDFNKMLRENRSK